MNIIGYDVVIKLYLYIYLFSKLDVGCAQLSMHSIRETGGTKDVETSIDLFKHYLQEFSELDEKFEIDYE